MIHFHPLNRFKETIRKTKHPVLHDISKEVRTVWVAGPLCPLQAWNSNLKIKDVLEMGAISEVAEEVGPEIPVATHL